MSHHTPATKFVAYYRVSTTGQGASGLGLEAQQMAVQSYLAANVGAELVAAFAEHEREMINQRTKEGLRAAKARGVVLGANSAALNKRPHSALGGKPPAVIYWQRNETTNPDQQVQRVA